jgi:hypothetical protein
MNTTTSARHTDFPQLNAYPGLRHHFTKAHEHVANDPDSSLVKSRVFADQLLTQIANMRGSPRQKVNEKEEDFHKLIIRLRRERHITPPQARLFFSIKDPGNLAAHGTIFSERESLDGISNIEALARVFRADLERCSQSTPVASFVKPHGAAPGPTGTSMPAPPLSPPAPVTRSGPARSNGFSTLAAMTIGILCAAGAAWMFVTGRVTNAPPPETIAVLSPVANSGTGVPVAFSSPQTYTVVPGDGLKDVNVRTGPCTEYSARQKLDRDTSVTGIGRAIDSAGNAWIQLADGLGYVKETLLKPRDSSQETSQVQTSGSAAQPVSPEQPTPRNSALQSEPSVAPAPTDNCPTTNLNRIYRMTGAQPIFEDTHWQAGVEQSCKASGSAADCLRSALQYRIEDLRQKIPQALASNYQSIFKVDAQRKWEQNQW